MFVVCLNFVCFVLFWFVCFLACLLACLLACFLVCFFLCLFVCCLFVCLFWFLDVGTLVQYVFVPFSVRGAGPPFGESLVRETYKMVAGCNTCS